ncbi:MAG: putative signaling protein [Paracidovorax wautersii]|uniref:diguanylate cyclase n=1 Tax=Paracidovorax wautersii TaxID=1177982 RepID=A0A7V8FRE6_9BURK|nr:MAG: putative signaling protein [Paracidovorax wautersii]
MDQGKGSGRLSDHESGLEQDLQRLLDDPRYDGHPLHGALSQLWAQYRALAVRTEQAVSGLAPGHAGAVDEQLARQLRQFQKLARISDRYQAMMRDLNAALTQASTHDVLTRLPNRRLLIDKLKEETARSRRTLEPFAVAMLDLDGFKTVNDDYGHEAGDAVLAQAARTLKAQLRDNDVCGRWGG